MTMTQEQRMMAEENHNLIYGFMDYINKRSEDLYGILAIALCNAAMNYDPEKGIKFSTYAYKCMENAYSTEVIKSNYDLRKICHNTVSYDTLAQNGEPLLDSIIDEKCDVEDAGIFYGMLSDCKKYCKKQVDYEIVYGHSIGLSNKTIAEKCNVSTQYLSRRKKHVKKLLDRVGFGS